MHLTSVRQWVNAHSVLFARGLAFLAISVLLGAGIAWQGLRFIVALLTVCSVAFGIYWWRSHRLHSQADTQDQPSPGPAAARPSSPVSTITVQTRTIRLKPKKKEARKKTPVHYLAPDEVSEVTRLYSGLSEEELKGVLYDEPHHFLVTLFMIFNPFWSQKKDIRPELNERVAEEHASAIDSSVRMLFELGVRFLQILYYAAIPILVTLPIWGTDHVPWLLTWWIPLCLIHVLLTCFWVYKIAKVSKRCRFVITDWTMMLVVNQLPWRDDDSIVIQYGLYSNSTRRRSILGKMLGFCVVAISTVDPGEPWPAWIYARKPDLLEEILSGWDRRKRAEMVESYRRSESSRAESLRPRPVVDLRNTQPIKTQAPS